MTSLPPLASTLNPAPRRDEDLAVLLIRSARHDADAFAEYYRLTAPMLNALVRRRKRSRRQREKALVAVYVAIWRQAGDFTHSRASSAWEWTLTILNDTLTDPPRWMARRVC